MFLYVYAVREAIIKLYSGGKMSVDILSADRDDSRQSGWHGKTDQQLYEQLKGGGPASHAALSMLYDRHSVRLFSYCRRIMNDSDIAHDIFQETFVCFYELGVRGAPVQNIQAYLTRIARNKCLNEKNNKNAKSITIPLEDLDLPVLDTPYEQTELTRLINTAIEMLPEELKEALLLREMHGYSYNEIADITESSMPIVRTRIFRAKQKIRKILAPFIEDLQ
jgi:RNA polymerase sigma-70 factor (ECF subfamily)